MIVKMKAFKININPNATKGEKYIFVKFGVIDQQGLHFLPNNTNCQQTGSST